MVMGWMMVLALLVSSAIAYAIQSNLVAHRGQEWGSSLSAAQAGIEDFVARLNRNDNYGRTWDCTNIVHAAVSVVTNISYDLNADTMQLLFTPMRNISDAEYELVVAAQANPEAQAYTMLTVAQADGVTKKPAAAKALAAPAKVTRSDEPDEDEPTEPTKRGGAKAAGGMWR